MFANMLLSIIIPSYIEGKGFAIPTGIKEIGWKDDFRAIYYILKYGLFKM